ncbi:4666_t:CDS:2, partial [Dentiscutata heterogama]
MPLGTTADRIWKQPNLFRVRGLYTYSKENVFYTCKLSTAPPDIIFFTPLRHLERHPNRCKKSELWAKELGIQA